jgi:hypothetical protein
MLNPRNTTSILNPFPDKSSKVLQRSTTSMPPLSSTVNVISDLSHKSPGGSSFIIPNAPSGLVTLHSGPSVASKQTDRWADALEQIEVSINPSTDGVLTINSNIDVTTESRDDNKDTADEQELTVAQFEIAPKQLQEVARELRARGIQVEKAEPSGQTSGNSSRSSSLATLSAVTNIVLVVCIYGLICGSWLAENEALKAKVAMLKGLEKKQDETEEEYFARFTTNLVELQEETKRKLAITAAARAGKAKTAAKEVSAKVFFRVCKGYNQMRASAAGRERRHHSGWYRLDSGEESREDSGEVLSYV